MRELIDKKKTLNDKINEIKIYNYSIVVDKNPLIVSTNIFYTFFF